MSEQEPSFKMLKWAAVGFGMVTVLISLAFFGWWSMRERFTFGHDQFDQVRWMAPVTAKTPPCDRGDMVLDIQHHVLRRGMSKSDVTMLLGRPAWEEATQLEYDLGVCLWVVHGLRLYFDANQQLAHAVIVQH